jgi:hypothetical protein
MLNIRRASGQAIFSRVSISLTHAFVILVIAAGWIYLTGCRTVSPQEDAQSLTPPTGAVSLPTTAYVELGVSPTLTPTPTLMPMTSFQNGVTYVTWTGDGFSSHESDLTLSQLVRPMGTNWIAVVVTCYQDSLQSTVIRCSPDSGTPSDESLIHVINYAHELGMRVMLKPHIDILADQGWRWQIDYGDDAARWQTWFQGYSTFVTHYAELAETLQVDYFVAGTELSGTVRHADEWRQVIADIRKVYSGPLTYASEMDEATLIQWWDELDAIGINAYKVLAQDNDPTLDELRMAWMPVANDLEQLSRYWDLPVVFTEIGYQSRDGTAQSPWNVETPSRDLEEQATAYQAALETFYGKDWVHGFFWWALTTNPNQGGVLDNGFSPIKKPAEDVLRAYYGAPPRPVATPTPSFVPNESAQLIIFDGRLRPGWQDWSWDATTHVPSRWAGGATDGVIRVSLEEEGALSLWHDPFDTSYYYWLEFYINVGENLDRHLEIHLHDQNDRVSTQSVALPDPVYLEGGGFLANRWQQVRVPLEALGDHDGFISRITIKNASQTGQEEFQLRDIRLVGAIAPLVDLR